MVFSIKNAASVPKAYYGFPGSHELPDTHGKYYFEIKKDLF